ncbi:unnamed protein product [Acanthoscelides obtectus]|uniref:Fibronectin type-III domain-containing protein n=1 Tax=Acanthoscelides obtectus TaxID=200917 RepID=A0A9P0PFJ5_ACAOB|nr:unnamed protein product [Acanthoscelides obtectus]CAK1655965.1 Contactin [Acanthoscelides obtectus]
MKLKVLQEAVQCINFERTYRKAPQKPPSSVNVTGVNPSTVRVTWRYVQPSLEEEPLQGYKVFQKRGCLGISALML